MLEKNSLEFASVTIGQVRGWLHEGDADTGVVICPGLGRDLRHAYRSLYVLAQSLSKHGYPVLRMEYLNTANSNDDLSQPLFHVWQNNVSEVVKWMQDEFGLTKIVVCGFRIGALISADESERNSAIIANILIEPVTSGKTFIRELHAMNAAQGVSNHGDTAWENEDFALRDLDVASIKAESIDRYLKRQRKILLLRSGQHINLFGSKYKSSSDQNDVTVFEFRAYQPMMKSWEGSEIPRKDFDIICTWLRQNVPYLVAKKNESFNLTNQIGLADWHERAIVFGHDRSLRGIICEPAKSSVDQKSAIIIGNLGTDPQFGIGRFNVNLSRNLASIGVTVLRFDYLGVGDSEDLPDGQPSLIYSTSRETEFSAAVDWLESNGINNIGAAGHCSGAFQALRAGISDRRIKHLILINNLVLRWRYKGPYSQYMKSWQRIFDFLSHKIFTKLRFIPALTPQYFFPFHAMNDLSKRKVNVCFVIGDEDSSRSDLEKYFGYQGSRVLRYPGFEIIRVPKTNHLISSKAMRKTVIDAITKDFVAKVIIK